MTPSCHDDELEPTPVETLAKFLDWTAERMAGSKDFDDPEYAHYIRRSAERLLQLTEQLREAEARNEDRQKLWDTLEAVRVYFVELQQFGDRYTGMLKLINDGLGIVSIGNSPVCKKHGAPFIIPNVCPFCDEEERSTHPLEGVK